MQKIKINLTKKRIFKNHREEEDNDFPYLSVEKINFIRFLLRDREKALRKTHVKPLYILSPKSTAMT